MGLAGGQQRVGLHVPRPGCEPAGVQARDELVAALRAHLEVVLEHDGLAVEHEAEAGIGGDEVEDGVDGVDEPPAEHFERSVPLAVPVEVGDEKDFGRHTETT